MRKTILTLVLTALVAGCATAGSPAPSEEEAQTDARPDSALLLFIKVSPDSLVTTSIGYYGRHDSDRQHSQDQEYRQLMIMGGVICALLLLLATSVWWYRRNVSWLKYQRDENARQVVLKSAKIQRLERNDEWQEQEIAQLRQQIDDHRQRISAKLLVGARLFLRLQQRQPIADCSSDERQGLIDYFAQLRPKRWRDWNDRYADLTTSQLIFLILQDDLHYDDETIAAILGVKPSTLRTTRSRMRLRKK